MFDETASGAPENRERGATDYSGLDDEIRLVAVQCERCDGSGQCPTCKADDFNILTAGCHCDGGACCDCFGTGERMRAVGYA